MIGCKQARIWLSLSVLVALASPAWALSTNRINDVRLTEQERGIVVEIAGERAPNFTTFKQDTPRRVIVDVAECALNGVPASIRGDGSLVGSISTRQYGQAPHGISRVVIQLLREAEYRVTIRGGSLFVHLSPGTGGLLVSAGVPVGPDRKPATKVARVEPRDQALAEELSEPEEVEEEDRGPAVTANPIPEPILVKIADPQTEPDTDRAGTPPAPAEESIQPVQVAMATLPPPAPRPAPAPIEVAQESEPAPVEEVEEVEEVPEEAVPEVPLPPPGADAAGMAAEENAVPPPPEEAVPMPPPPEEESAPPPEEVVPPPPPEEAVPPPPPPDTYASDAEERVEISSAVKHMTWVGFQQTSSASRVFIKTNEPVEYRLTEEGDKMVVLELENTTIPLRNNKRFLDTHFFDSAVTLITPREIHGVGRNVRVEIQVKRKVPYRVGREDNLVYINFERPQ